MDKDNDMHGKNKYDCTPDEYARRAANPDSMGKMQENGRDTESPQMRDRNHPQGSGNHRPGIETA